MPWASKIKYVDSQEIIPVISLARGQQEKNRITILIFVKSALKKSIASSIISQTQQNYTKTKQLVMSIES